MYSNYAFDNLSRIGLDACSLSQESIQNVHACNYMTQNFFASESTMRRPIDFATSQPGINYTGGHGSGPGGSNINQSSELLIGQIQTHPRCHIDLFQRPFATVPYLGRGSVNPVTESQIMQGEQFVNKKTASNLSEKQMIKYHETPLLPNVRRHLMRMQEDQTTSTNWVRGGIPSRELDRDQNYMNK